MPLIFLRNSVIIESIFAAVAILCVLSCSGKKYVVCCRQVRLALGQVDYLEIPAGMLDTQTNSFAVGSKVRGLAIARILYTLPILVLNPPFSPLCRSFSKRRGYLSAKASSSISLHSHSERRNPAPLVQ